jgi:hypothetical protein
MQSPLPPRSASRATAIALLLLVGCRTDDALGRSPSLSGNWSMSAELTNAASGIRCAGDGLLSLSVQGTALSGAGTFPRVCSGAALTTATEHSFTGILLDADTVRWHDTLGCTYTGRRVSPSRLEGTVVCTVQLNERDVTLLGTWSATR